MNRTGKTLLLLATLGAGINVQAEPARYETIVDRNIFRLTSPPPPPVVTNVNEALEKNIELSGISNIGGKKKAWFIIKPKTGAKEAQYVNLSENERHEFLEVVSIAEAEGEVKVLSSGSSMVLSFKNNAPKVTPGTAAPPVPIAGARPVTPQPIAPTSYASAAPSASYGGGSSVTVSGGAPSTSQFGQTAENGLRSIPTRQLRVAPQPEAEAIHPQKQRELMEIQKAVYEAANVPLPPLPPTATINSSGGGVNNGGVQTAPPAFPPIPGRR